MKPGKPRLLLLTSVAALAGMLSAPAAHALISVAPGTYEVSAVVVRDTDGPTAVFNVRTRSECRILLTGPATAKLEGLDEGLRAYRLKFVLRKKLLSRHGTAELLDASLLEEGARLPQRVGNNLKPSK